MQKYENVRVQPYFCAGEMAERSIAAVLKTVEGKTSGGSNPSLSAAISAVNCQTIGCAFVFCAGN